MSDFVFDRSPRILLSVIRYLFIKKLLATDEILSLGIQKKLLDFSAGWSKRRLIHLFIVIESE